VQGSISSVKHPYLLNCVNDKRRRNSRDKQTIDWPADDLSTRGRRHIDGNLSPRDGLPNHRDTIPHLCRISSGDNMCISEHLKKILLNSIRMLFPSVDNLNQRIL
jgi:hypothetical protein